MRSVLALWLAGVWLGLCACWPVAAQTDFLSGSGLSRHHTQVVLRLSADTARPGDTVWAGVDLTMDPGWHTYWQNAGDAGTPTKIQWALPPGVSAGEIRWPLPQKLPPAEVTTYGYEGEAILLVPLTLATNLSPAKLTISATVSWLECKDVCIPASQQVATALAVGPQATPSADAALLQMAAARTPRSDRPFLIKAWWEKPLSDDTRPLIIEGSPLVTNGPAADHAEFFPAPADQYEIESATELIPHTAGFELRKQVKKYAGDWPASIHGLVVVGSENQRSGFEVDLPVGDHAPAAAVVRPAVGASSSSSPEPTTSFGQMFLYAFLGGLILNCMPCVLPVIALKILGFVSEARSEPRRVRWLGMLYALGVLASFLALALVVVGLRAAGHHAGWGMQFGSPVFLVLLTTLVVLVALNLFGVFEMTLSGRTLDTASQLASRSGGAGAFFNGILATTLATPCTAPFLAPALGFAFAQTAPIILLVFLTVGLGLASPYLVLSWQPAWLRVLPKPGAWMEKFKICMGFPMLATALWLGNVASSSYGNVVWLGAFLLVLALAAWIFGEFVQRGRTRRALAAMIAALLLLGGYQLFLEQQLHWRQPRAEPEAAGNAADSAGGIAWQLWTPQAVTAAQAAGRAVLVDFTADWCLTCQVNRKTSLEAASVREKLKALNAVALVGDYTHFPDPISDELARFHRAGVPLVLVYPPQAGAPAIVLPAVLTPGIVLQALGGDSHF